MRLLLLAALVLGAASPAGGQGASQAPSGAPIVIGTDTAFTIATAQPPYTVQQRALAVTANLAQVISTADPGERIRVVPSPTGPALMLGSTALMHVTQADADAAGVPADTLAARWAAGLQAAIAHRSRTSATRELLVSWAEAIAATLAFAFLVWLLYHLEARVEGILRGWAESRVRRLDPEHSRLVSPAQVARAAVALTRALRLGALLLLGYFWLVTVLGAFASTAPVAGRILRYVTGPLESIAGSVVGYLPSLIFIVVVVAALRLVLRFIRLFFRAVEQGTVVLRNFPADWASPTYTIVRALVLAFGLILVFPYLPGAGSDAFKAISLFAGALFSLGSSGAVANLVSGAVITYTRAFRIGDHVRIGETQGTVIERSLLVTRIRNSANVVTSIPSAAVLGAHVQNFTTMAEAGGVAVQCRVTIGYDVPWRTVHELLLRAARDTEGVLATPEPFVVQEALSDYYPAYCLHAFTDRSLGMELLRLRSRLHEAIQDRFFEAGVEILSPAYTSLRDGNRTAMPPDYLPADYRAPGFRVTPP